MSLRENYEYPNWRQVSKEEFQKRWPSFSPQELACKGTGKLLLNFRALDMLQKLRNKLGRPMILNSAYRSKEHNRAVGGATNSQHMLGTAFDCRMENQNPEAFERAAVEVGMRGIGHYPGSNFMHVDARQASTVVRWKGTGRNNRWFFTATSRPAAATSLMASVVSADADAGMEIEVQAPLTGLETPVVSGRPFGSGLGAAIQDIVADVAVDVAKDALSGKGFGEDLPDFTTPRPDTLIQMIKELAPVLIPLLAGPAAAVSTGNGPVQWGIAGMCVLLGMGGLLWVYRKKQTGIENENA